MLLKLLQRVNFTTSFVNTVSHLESLTDFETILHYAPHLQEVKEALAIVQAELQFDDGCELSDEDNGYPGYSESPWASYSDSDTPDCRHKGINKVPCRFYNHGGCNKGTACKYSHAPDEKSVRDEL